ncbi:c-type cytochrome [Marinobacter maritimus]|uniref:c-type cytochrome n=1 Tax=Marinobacter maritimus TaxID=277961 RepID=UPI0011A1B58E|nr:cytochrome c [Marinobacter maritimus]|tara:strand:+ start:4258 stop:4575 length:318 start_codon:yes stop_codon:yes gene_type:complete
MKLINIKQILIAVIFGGVALPNLAADAAAGAEKIATCIACHGVDGQSSAPIYPNLAGQPSAYLELALKAYREGERTGGMSAVMTPQATKLTDEDIADMSAYYSEQ